MPLTLRRAVAPLLALLLALAAALTGAPATAGAAATVGAGAQDDPSRSAPEGGPVDDGWLPADGTAFSDFEGEPAPGGGPVWPGVRRDARTTRVGGKPVDVQILHLDPGAAVTVQPTLALGSVRGLAPVSVQSGDPLAGMVAAVNGGFWLRDPLGEPNGYLARDGRLVSDAESQGVGPRGTVGWTADGQVLIDRIDTLEQVVLPDGSAVTVDGINRGHREHDEMFADGVDSALAYTTDLGGSATLRAPRRPEGPAGGPVRVAVVRIAVDRWPSAGTTVGRVTALEREVEGVHTPVPGEVVLHLTGARAAAFDAVQVGDVVSLSTTVRALDSTRDAAWAGVVRGLAGGPLIVSRGRMTDPGDWVSEGFEPRIHSDVRAPRTAIGVTQEGRTLMVTADGRRPGITVGFTIAELARYMIALGAVDAVSLDGGGSSQMVVDGILRNVPCCDAVVRSVADSLQVVHAEPFDGTDRLRGAGRVDTAASAARHAHPDGSTTAVLATASGFPDALAGGPLAGVLDGPLLLTATDGLPHVTAEALRALGVRRAALLGGPAVIGDAVADELRALGIQPVRVAGGSRYDTAAAIAEALRTRVAEDRGQQVTRAFIASADGFADALAAAGPGGILGMPILLSARDRLHPATIAALAGLEEVVLVGGTARLGQGVETELRARGLRVTRLAGDGRFGTARAVNDWLADQTDLADGLVVATGGDFPDALAGGPLAASRRVPLMILPVGTIDGDPDAAAFFRGLDRLDDVDVLGGLGVVSSYQQWQLEQLTEGPPPPGPAVCPPPLPGQPGGCSP